MKKNTTNPIHELLGKLTDRPDGFYEQDEFGFSAIVVVNGKVTETRAVGRSINRNHALSPRAEEMLAVSLAKIALLKQELTNS